MHDLLLGTCMFRSGPCVHIICIQNNMHCPFLPFLWKQHVSICIPGTHCATDMNLHAVCRFIGRHALYFTMVAGADLGFLEWWGCDSNARKVRAKILGHADLIKTTPILITSHYLALSLNESTKVPNARLF